MMASRLDITQIFWDVDDFCNQWSRLWNKQKQLDKILLRKRALIETVSDQLKNLFQIEHSIAS